MSVDRARRHGARAPAAGRGTGRRARDFRARLLGRTDGLIGLAILAVFTLLAAVPGAVRGAARDPHTHDRRAAPATRAPQYSFGTDELGRDMLNLTVHGARISMTIGLMATLITIVIGSLVGIVAGFVGGTVDNLLMRLSDFFLVLPTIVLALILAPIMLDVIGPQAELFGIRSTLIVIVVVIGLTELGDDRPRHPQPGALAQGADVRRPGPGHGSGPGGSCAATSCPTS